jgi:hypothetical protein
VESIKKIRFSLAFALLPEEESALPDASGIFQKALGE